MTKNSDRLIYMPLGGAGEIGMNMYLYGYGPKEKERFILVDVGVTFGDMESAPGIDLIMPDIDWIAKRADRLEGIFITHGHEDHVGALGHLWPRLQAKVYARRFTTALAQGKMERAGLDTTQVREVDPWPHMVNCGPFKVGFAPVSHSIPESSSLVIETETHRILHTGDFKVDPAPIVGEPFDPEQFRKIGDLGVDILICDSTNVFSANPGRSESTLQAPITDLIKSAEGLMVATTFASNVARLKTLAEAGRAAGRQVVILGRAMNTMLRNAEATGVLDDFPPILDATDAADYPRSELLVLATGSQGERRAASAQLANGKYMGFELKQGDTFLFSSKTIPGNEVSVSRILNALSEKGVTAIDDSAEIYHVSGHPNRPDLLHMYDLVRPKMVVPMHGEHRHLSEHVKLAQEHGIPAALATNGTMLDLSAEKVRVVDEIEAGRTYLDGTELIGARDGVVLSRIRMALRGHLAISVLVEEDGQILDSVWVEALGLPDISSHRDGLQGLLEEEIMNALRKDKKKALDDDALDDLIQKTCARVCNTKIGKKPMCTVMISRLEP